NSRDASSFYSSYATVALDTATGTQLWTTSYQGSRSSEDDSAKGIAISPSGSRLFITGVRRSTIADDSFTIAYQAATGNKIWTAKGSDPVVSDVTSSPDGTVVYVTGDTKTKAYTSRTGTLLW